MVLARASVLIFAAALLLSGADSASRLYHQARKAQSKGDYRNAFALANRAVALEPANREYWAFAQAVRTRGLEGASFAPPAAPLPTAPDAEADASEPLPEPAPIDDEITEQELKQARETIPPHVLEGKPGLRDFNLRGDAKQLFEKVAQAYGLDVVFDSDFQGGSPIQFRVNQMDWKTALRSLESVTSSFLVPMSARVALVAKDTPQKRTELEPVMSVVVPFPEPISPQDLQEAVRAVQSAFDMTKVGIDNNRRQILFRDRVSRLKPALEILRQLMVHRGQVVTEVDLLAFTNDWSNSYGLALQKTIPLVLYGNPTPFTVSASTATYPYLGGGGTQFGVGVSSATLVAAYSKNQTKSLMHSELRGVDNQPATLHIGDRYPIITSAYSGASGSTSTTGTSAYAMAPSISFEDLGINLKVTPHVHGAEGVTLELEAEIKSLSGSTLNNIPVISNRKFTTKVRLSFEETAVVSGLSQQLLTAGWSGMPPVSSLIPLRQNDKSFTNQELLLTIRPRLVSLPPTESEAPPLWVGTESRSRTPLD